MFSALFIKGIDGLVDGSLIKSGKLHAVDKERFPKKLLYIMKRQAEDLLLGNSNDPNGIDALEFIRNLTLERSDVEEIKEGELSRNSHKTNN